ncbi:unnamed protein product [Pieris macdunnoughi]|uniref:Uncharacterized protein n=1 Tax=Pieris macdunnoughi TaxID=345717 RepID=A0A821P538_9NEOP|nr:unnamed protein product [Pieris macdunnoughi]
MPPSINGSQVGGENAPEPRQGSANLTSADLVLNRVTEKLVRNDPVTQEIIAINNMIISRLPLYKACLLVY